MKRQISGIPSNPGDSNRRILFSMHFFACLFHELSHGYEVSRLVMNNFSVAILDSESKPAEAPTQEQLEQLAVGDEGKFLGLLKTYLYENKMSWPRLSEHLFDWDKLQKHIKA